MATIRIKDQSKGTTTDMEGRFSLECQVGDADHLLCGTGGADAQGINEIVTIRLKESTEMLETVVVNRMVAQDKRLFTGATSTS